MVGQGAGAWTLLKSSTPRAVSGSKASQTWPAKEMVYLAQPSTMSSMPWEEKIAKSGVLTPVRSTTSRPNCGQKSDMKNPRCNFASVTFDSRILAFGGERYGQGVFQGIADVESYDEQVQ